MKKDKKRWWEFYWFRGWRLPIARRLIFEVTCDLDCWGVGVQVSSDGLGVNAGPLYLRFAYDWWTK